MSAVVIKALFKARQEFKPLKQSAANTFFKVNGRPAPYSTLEDVDNAIGDALSNNGLMASQQVVRLDGEKWLKLTLYHESGEYLDMGYYPLSTTEVVENVTGQDKSGRDIHTVTTTDIDPQKLKGSVTYARRSQLLSALGLNGDPDDDGNFASGKTDGSYSGNNSSNKVASISGKQLYAMGMQAFQSNQTHLSAFLKSNGVPSGNTNSIPPERAAWFKDCFQSKIKEIEQADKSF